MLKSLFCQKLINRGLRCTSWLKRAGFCEPLTPEMEILMRCRKDSKLETCIIDDSMINPCWDNPKVVIIGAGMAGLSAAAKLSKSGFLDLVVLEATDRPGGRIHSCWLGETVTEVGASYLHGTSVANPAFPLATQEKLISTPMIKESYDGLMLTSDSEIITQFITAAADACFKTILKQAADLFVKCGPGTHCGTLFDFISNRIDQEIQIFPSEFKCHAAKVMVNRMIDLQAKVGAELDKVAACHFGTLVDIPGGNIRIPSGMVGILAPLLRSMPKCDSIRYCKPVEKIEYCADEQTRCRVHCCDGDIFFADYVIVTVSLGVLKMRAKDMFEPELPKEKIQAISGMGFGLVNHLYLEYETPFWLWGEGSLRLGWNFHEMVEKRSWTNGISSITNHPSSQQILEVTVGGEAASCIETLSDEQLAQDVTKTQRYFLNNPTLPYPVNVLRSKWCCSPYFYGAKSYFGMGTTLRTQCDLAKPVPDGCGLQPPAVLFAGEATAIGAHGTIHGARTSGLNEAGRIITLTKQLKGKPKVPEQTQSEAAN